MTAAKSHLGVWLVAATAFLAMAIGGQVSTDSLAIAPGVNPIALALTGATETPLLTHTIILLPLLIACIYVAGSRRVIQVPPATPSLALAILVLSVIFSIALSNFRSVSMESTFHWIAAVGSYVATVAIAGRQRGPQIILLALFLGAVVTAIRGVLEYGDMKAIDPTWRIFAGWVNPNAAAIALAVGFFAGLHALLTSQGLRSLLAGLGLGVIGLAFVLTQSKGAFLAIAVGLFFAALAAIAGDRANRGRNLLRMGAIVAVVVALSFALVQTQSAGGGAAVMSRVAGGAETQEQSNEFRQLLWRGAILLIKENPAGSGPGTYMYESARPGLTTQTYFTHNSYLQLAVESGVIAVLALAIFAVNWIYRWFRSLRVQDADLTAVRIAVGGLVAAVGAHSLIDSDLHYFGIAIATFVALGLGTLATTDGVTPEFVPPSIRRTVMGVAAFAGLFGIVMAWAETSRGRTRGALYGRDPAARAMALGHTSTFPLDGEGWALRARTESEPAEMLHALKQAAFFAPSTRNLRALAAAQEQSGQFDDALLTLSRALTIDPNNLLTLSRKISIERAHGLDDAARVTAKRLMAVEATPYFQIRSLPELVPTETFAARAFLAQSTSPRQQITLLRPALDGYVRYATTTVPWVTKSLDPQTGAGVGGVTVEKMVETLNEGIATGEMVAAAYRAVGDSVNEATVARDIAALRAALPK